MQHRNFWAVGLLTLAVALTGCGNSGDDQQQSSNSDQSQAASDNQNQTASSNQSNGGSSQPVNLIFGTGGTSGTYYPIGGALKSVFEKSHLVGDVQVVSTGASVQNINNIMDGTNQLAIVMSDVAYSAVNGKDQFKGRPAKIDAIAGLYPNVVQVVAVSSSNIHKISDLKGKRVGVGKVGSGVEASAKKTLEAAGLSYDDLAKVSHTGYAASVTQMKNGNLDAAFFTSGVPNSNISGLRQNADINFVEIKNATAKKLLDKYPFYQSYTIPAHQDNKYNLDQAAHMVAIRNMLIVPASMDNNIAEALTKRFYDYLGSDGVSISALKQFEPSSMNKNLVLPVHPGAAKFYESVGIRPDSDNQDSNG